jgi:glucose dehydrogenase
MNFFSSLMISVFYDQFTILAEEINKSFHLPGLEMIMEGKSIFFAVSALIYAGCITGAILMWKLKKAGFHVYTIFQILLILSPMYFFHLPSPSLLDIILSGIFILLYSSNLKYMS